MSKPSKQAMISSLISLTWIPICACCGQAGETSGPFRSEQRVADVLAGKIEVANAAWWGFDEKDSTAALQGAINSGAKTVIVPYVGKKWIVKPIDLVSNQEIVFAPGVIVAAKKGEFKGDHDSLFRAAQKENITLRGYGARWQMRKEDYRDPNHYIRAEWRMGLMCLSSKDIEVLGLTIAETGGDGIYLGSSAAEFIGIPAYNRNIVIKDCIFENNYRQGISVIGAKNLVIENCVFRNTSGTPPAGSRSTATRCPWRATPRPGTPWSCCSTPSPAAPCTSTPSSAGGRPSPWSKSGCSGCET